MQHDEVERLLRQALNLLRCDRSDFQIIGKSRSNTDAYEWRSVAEQNLARDRRDNIGVERFARTVIEHACGGGGQVACDLLRNQPIMDVLMACIDIDRT